MLFHVETSKNNEGNNKSHILSDFMLDGENVQEPALQGTYTYVYNVWPENTCAGEELNYIGNVTLLK